MSNPSTADVAIVGSGPAGLATALMLRKRNIDVIVLETALEPSTTSRALVIHSRTLEALEAFDLTNPILERAKKLTHWEIARKSRQLAELDFSTLQAK
jgi:2-polyprenyl-6-methoxyphenol hydroxylase-like FAD-dependent oxidoreductase